jgi:hypothetical protein
MGLASSDLAPEDFLHGEPEAVADVLSRHWLHAIGGLTRCCYTALITTRCGTFSRYSSWMRPQRTLAVMHARGWVRSGFLRRSSRMSLQQAPPGPRLPVSFSRVCRSDSRSVKVCQVVPVRDMCGRPVAGRSRCPDGGAATAYQPRPPSSPVSRREPSNVLWPPAGNPSNRGWLVVVRCEDRRGARRT